MLTIILALLTFQSSLTTTILQPQFKSKPLTPLFSFPKLTHFPIPKQDKEFHGYRTSLGWVKIIPLVEPLPIGWRALQFDEGVSIQKQLYPLLKEWSVVVIGKGKIAGPGYGYEVMDHYGPETGEKFIIKRF